MVPTRFSGCTDPPTHTRIDRPDYRMPPVHFFDGDGRYNKETKQNIHPKHKRNRKKTALANRTIYNPIWHAYYDLRPGNNSGTYSYSPRAHTGPSKCTKVCRVIFCRDTRDVILKDCPRP